MARRIDVEIGARAWEAAHKAHTNGDLAVYRSRAVELATMLQQSGLTQTLSYLASRNDANQRKVAFDLANELRLHLSDAPDPNDGLGACVAFLLNTDEATRSMASVRAALFADWLKRAVETLKHDQEQSAPNDQSQPAEVGAPGSLR